MDKSVNIPASSLKSLVKKLGAVKAEQVVFGKSRFIASEPDLTVVVQNDFPEDLSGFAVNLRKFSSVVNRLSGDVTLSLAGGGLVLSSAKTRIVLETQEGKRPLFTKPAVVQAILLPEVQSLLRYATTCAEPDRAHIYGGVVQLGTRVEGIDTETVVGLFAAGASEQRVATVESTVTAARFSTLIPLSSVPAVLALESELFLFSETDKQIYFEAAGVEIYVAKLAKKYPNCASVIPKEFKYVFEVSAEEFKTALRVVEPIIDTRDSTGCGVNVHFLDFSATIGSLGLGDSAQDAVSYTQITPDPIFESVDFSVNLKHRFLSDFFGSVSGTVTISANDPAKPVLLEAGNKKMLLAVMKGEE